MDEWDDKDGIIGVYMGSKWVPWHDVEIYYIFRDTKKGINFGPEGSGQLDEHTIDGVRGTFDNLYPTNHLHYGYMDRASLQNLNNVRLQGSARPVGGVYVQVDVHMMRVYDTRDALYNAGRKAYRLATDPEGVSSYVGTELDFLLKWKVNRYVSILAGYTHFFAGEYLRATGGGDDGQFFYMQTSIKL